MPCLATLTEPTTMILPSGSSAIAVAWSQYPSGGAVQRWVGLWRALAPSIKAIAPDIYGDDAGFVHDVLTAYHRPDNPLLVPEIAKTDQFAKYDFSALGEGAVGIAPFGVDPRGWNILGNSAASGHARNFALLAPMVREIATLNYEGKLKTSIEQTGLPQQELDFGDWQATISYGYPQPDGRRPPGNSDAHGVALVAQLGPDDPGPRHRPPLALPPVQAPLEPPGELLVAHQQGLLHDRRHGGLAGARVYLIGTNLLLLMDHLGDWGYDPEMDNIRAYPLMRTFAVGVDVALRRRVQ